IKTLLTAPGQPFEIEEITLNGNSVKSWKNAASSLPAMLEASKAFGDRDYIVYQDERLSYAEHYRQVARLANHLVDRYGLNKGDRVALAMRNYPEWSVAFWAATAAGAIVVPMNAWWTSSEMEYGLSDAGCVVAIVDEERLQRIQAIECGLPLQHLLATRCKDLPEGVDDLAPLLTEGNDTSLPGLDLAPEDDATLFYTSGTTGFPKGTLGTHRNFCSAPLSGQYLGVLGMLRSGAGLEELAAMANSRPVALLPVPLFHVTGCQGLMASMFSSGGTVVMMYKWDPAVAADLIAEEGITAFAGVPAMTRQLIDLPDIEQRDLSSLTAIASGGASVPPEQFRRMKSALTNAGVTNGYGITETSSIISSIGGLDYQAKPESAGPSAAVCDVKVIGDGGAEVPTGELGEFWVRGPNVVKGYWNRPDATAEAFVNGWYRTGDIGRLDEDGFLYIVDRIKDMIIRGGENIYCAEVEAAISEHDQVNAACVFGIPDEVLGEQVAAVVEILPKSGLTEEDLRSFVAAKMASFKIPAKIWFHDEPLPLGATGKVQKKELRALYVEEK
ncbi:MAG: acyl--CoA ligase, partial [Gammaproteobacteria bacterium]|nr:acyl--CoA ligase [Gammaproteobacteria bacterium]